jgi:hypothetical protein
MFITFIRINKLQKCFFQFPSGQCPVAKFIVPYRGIKTTFCIVFCKSYLSTDLIVVQLYAIVNFFPPVRDYELGLWLSEIQYNS